jgi:glycosyltransferase involved in cell wall biosynthesis
MTTSEPSAPGLPACSVVVPTYARPALLAGCLEALASQDYPRDRFEVIVVDDGGLLRDSILVPLRGRLDVALVTQARAGPAAARNTGLAQARGTLVAFTDDDCRPAPDWLRRLALAHVGRPDAMLGGLTVTALRSGLLAAASQVVIDAGRAHSEGTRAPGFFPSNNLAAGAGPLREIGGFDASFARAEDRDLCDRWTWLGLPLLSVPEAVVEHRWSFTPRSFLAQHLANGRSVYRFHRAHSVRAGAVRPEPAYYGTLLRLAYDRARGVRGLELAGLVALSQLANTAGYVAERLGREGRE